MPENTAPAVSTIENLLADIAAKLGELVAIETYLAKKASETISVLPAAPVPAQNVPAQPAPSPNFPAPVAAAPAAPATPSRPGAGTIGGLVWDYCDGLNKQLGRAPTKDELIAALKQYMPTFNGQPVNELTAATQYSKWRASQGLPKLPRGFGAQRQAAAPAAQPAAPAAVPAPSAPTIGAPATQPAQTAMALPMIAPAPAPAQPAPIPAASVPSVINPTAAPAPSIPPWLRG